MHYLQKRLDASLSMDLIFIEPVERVVDIVYLPAQYGITAWQVAVLFEKYGSSIIGFILDQYGLHFE